MSDITLCRVTNTSKKKQPHDSHQVNSKKTRQFSLYHYVRETPLYFPPILHYMQHILILTGATSGAGTAYPSGAPEFTPVFSGVRVTRSLVLYICFVDRCLSFCTFSFGHCVICSSSIYGFWLPPFGIFKLFLIKMCNSCGKIENPWCEEMWTCFFLLLKLLIVILIKSCIYNKKQG